MTLLQAVEVAVWLFKKLLITMSASVETTAKTTTAAVETDLKLGATVAQLQAV